MKLFFDTEFTGLIQHTSLISLALVDENDRTFYAECTDYDPSQLSAWLEDNVIKNLKLTEQEETQHGSQTYVKGTKSDITASLTRWLDAYRNAKCQVVADVPMYDWVLLAELFGGALNLPPFLDYMPIDFASLLYASGQPMHTPRIELLDAVEVKILREKCPFDGLHNALYDTHLLKMCFEKWQKMTA